MFHGEEGFLSAVFSGPSTRGMNESGALVTVIFGEVSGGGSSSLLEHSQHLFTPSDTVSVEVYSAQAKDKTLRHNLNVYVTFTPSQLEAKNIVLIPGKFYFLELTFESHYRDYSLRCVRLDVVHTPAQVTTQRVTSYNVQSFGAVGDGSTDDTIAIQSAVNAAAAVGGTVYIPTGHYRTTSSLLVPGGVSVVGAGLGSNPRDMSGMKGTILLYRGEEFAMVLQGDLIEVKNLVVYDNGEKPPQLICALHKKPYACCVLIRSAST
jgi:hypothetical protein